MARPQDTVPGPGGSRKLSPEYQSRVKATPKGGKVQPVPVTIAPQPGPGAAERVTRLGTPVALLMLVGLFLVYYALHGWDKKYGVFGGAFAGLGNVPTGTKPRYTTTPSTPTTSTSVATPQVQLASTTATTASSDAITTLRRYIANLSAIKNPSATQQAELLLYTQRLQTYEARQSV